MNPGSSAVQLESALRPAISSSPAPTPASPIAISDAGRAPVAISATASGATTNGASVIGR